MKTYRITELGRLFGLSRSTLLYYHSIGLLKPSGRSRAAYRLYAEADRERLERICFLREAGLSLAEISHLLEGSNNESAILERRLQEIGHEILTLKAQQRHIAGMCRTLHEGFAASGLDHQLCKIFPCQFTGNLPVG